jgi:hypothetical protein
MPGDLGEVAGKLKGVMSMLNTWSREKFGAVSSEIKRIRKRLEELRGTENKEDEEDVSTMHCRLMSTFIVRKWCGFRGHVLLGWKKVIETWSFSTKELLDPRRRIRSSVWKGRINKRCEWNAGHDNNFFKDLFKMDSGVNPSQIYTNQWSHKKWMLGCAKIS